MARWEFEPGHSAAEFCVRHMMVTWVRGHFKDIHGSLEFDPDNPATLSVTVEIAARKLWTGEPQRDEHLRSADFLDVANYPEITFKSTRITGDKSNFKLTGNLTIRGVTREVTLDVTNEGTTKDPWGGDRVAFSATTKLDRREFGLTWNQAIEAGGVLVGNDVKVSIDVQAVKQA